MNKQEIINAHEALDKLKDAALIATSFGGDTKQYLAWREEVLAALPPKPQLTMEGVEWNHDEHYLAEVEHPHYGTCLMLEQRIDERITCISDNRNKYNLYHMRPQDITLTGKRYTLTEEDYV